LIERVVVVPTHAFIDKPRAVRFKLAIVKDVGRENHLGGEGWCDDANLARRVAHLHHKAVSDRIDPKSGIE
jgi:hypothetical protein